MPALDLTEIPPAQSGALRDQFELFARATLEALGFSIVEAPDRGADGGRDLIVEETRTGPGGVSTIRWLVSCKHKAHSGASVLPADEANVRDRLGTHSCRGFIAFYSTVPSSGLGLTLNALKPDFEYLRLDPQTIEARLLATPEGRGVAARYMPVSFGKWMLMSQTLAPAASTPDPQRSTTRYFLRTPHSDLAAARDEAGARDLPIFAVLYDPDHETRSKLDFSLGYFMEYGTTKRLVDQHFVPLVAAVSDPELAALVPEDDPLELCLWVVMEADGAVLRREGVYANPDEGLKRTRAVVAARNAARST